MTEVHAAARNIVPESCHVLALAIRNSWTAETSASDEWDAARSEIGQCAVTALIVQDWRGGDLLRAIVNGESHYWNRLPSGVEMDLTRAQFDLPLDIGEVVIRDREYVLGNAETAHRYETLKQNLKAIH